MEDAQLAMQSKIEALTLRVNHLESVQLTPTDPPCDDVEAYEARIKALMGEFLETRKDRERLANRADILQRTRSNVEGKYKALYHQVVNMQQNT